MLEREKEQWKELRVQVCLMLARAHTTSSPVRGRKRKRERERERGRKSEREMSNMSRNGFFKGMAGALAPFSYLVLLELSIRY
jgi:hypothetical protein